MQTYDVTILGGGLAGLTLARQLLLKNPELSIAILERKAFPVPEIAHKVGESTVEIGAHYLSEVVQLKKHLIDDQLPKFGLRFFSATSCRQLPKARKLGEVNSSPPQLSGRSWPSGKLPGWSGAGHGGENVLCLPRHQHGGHLGRVRFYA